MAAEWRREVEEALVDGEEFGIVKRREMLDLITLGIKLGLEAAAESARYSLVGPESCAQEILELDPTSILKGPQQRDDSEGHPCGGCGRPSCVGC